MKTFIFQMKWKWKLVLYLYMCHVIFRTRTFLNVNLHQVFLKSMSVSGMLGVWKEDRRGQSFLWLFLLIYFIAILQWSIGNQFWASNDVDVWRHLEVLRRTSRFLPIQCASRWFWGVPAISFLAGSILMRCGKFRFDFFAECVLSNHIFFF